MAKFQPWLKMWVEWLDDIKMLDLSLAEQGAWWRLVTLTKKCAADGALVKDNGAPLSLDEIASTLRIKTKADRKVFDAMIRKMTVQGSLHWDSNALVVTHFAERQAKTTSETPEAVRDRVRRYREHKAVTEKAVQEKEPVSAPPLPSPLNKDIYTEAEGNGRNSVTSEPALAKISKLYEENFGILTSNLAEKFKFFVENYRGPVEWIDLAFAE
ncbi:unnamed protein product, partial [marine sediment metagenome]